FYFGQTGPSEIWGLKELSLGFSDELPERLDPIIDQSIGGTPGEFELVDGNGERRRGAIDHAQPWQTIDPPGAFHNRGRDELARAAPAPRLGVLIKIVDGIDANS